MAVMVCDDLIQIDPASGRAVSRDLHAAAFRRGRAWPSLCFPEAVVLSLPRAFVAALSRRSVCHDEGSRHSVNDLVLASKSGRPGRPRDHFPLLSECSSHHELDSRVSGA